jgi:glutathione S-transferase
LAALVACSFEPRVSLVQTDPWTEEGLRTLNPLCKVPTLELSTGLVLYDSPVIARFLNESSGGKLLPADERSWDALRREALGDGLAEAVIRRYVETLGPSDQRVDKVIRRQEAAISAVLDALESAAPSWTGWPADIGHLAIAAALDYMSLRSPELQWGESRPLLEKWFYDFRRHACMRVAAAPDSGNFRLAE